MGVGMTPEMRALARRAVVCKRWRLLTGMRLASGRFAVRLLWVGPDGDWLGATDGGARIHCTDEDWLPDFTDHATLGCLLALVREARSKTVHTYPYGPEWFVGFDWCEQTLCGPIEAHALVAALEAVP